MALAGVRCEPLLRPGGASFAVWWASVHLCTSLLLDHDLLRSVPLGLRVCLQTVQLLASGPVRELGTPRGRRPREGPSCPRGGVARAARTVARSAFGFRCKNYVVVFVWCYCCLLGGLLFHAVYAVYMQ